MEHIKFIMCSINCCALRTQQSNVMAEIQFPEGKYGSCNAVRPVDGI
jgi:hypothetical protein